MMARSVASIDEALASGKRPRCRLQPRQPQVPPRLAARLHNVFGQNLGLPQLVFKSRQAVLDTVQVRAPP